MTTREARMHERAERKAILGLLKRTRLGHKLDAKTTDQVVETAMAISAMSQHFISLLKERIDMMADDYVSNEGDASLSDTENRNEFMGIATLAMRIAAFSLSLGSEGELRPLLDLERAQSEADGRPSNYSLRVLVEIVEMNIEAIKANTNIYARTGA